MFVSEFSLTQMSIVCRLKHRGALGQSFATHRFVERQTFFRDASWRILTGDVFADIPYISFNTNWTSSYIFESIESCLSNVLFFGGYPLFWHRCSFLFDANQINKKQLWNSETDASKEAPSILPVGSTLDQEIENRYALAPSCFTSWISSL